ncbi:GNAT family N-acetyltransferase [Paramicrobacterium agarici]|uniref:GNAT family N-acetyltransferase n=1 Tax=Paramicrobacterium agarici TaxID=630514 RepID=UPI00114EBBA3|nr:GNAT family N-acetyltransferase [Microbacterium agarici]TQO22005.1 ribosomal protein S18 acetylase RimI-like enzyme [Microbacterium agarici]
MTVTSVPLRDRVAAPELVLPQHPDIARWRPATLDDLDAMMVLMDAADRVDHPASTTTRAEVENALRSSKLIMATDTLVGESSSGVLIAAGVVAEAQAQSTRVQVYLEGTVHPQWRDRGIGRQLLAWQRDRALQILSTSPHALPGWIMVDQEQGNIAGQHVSERAGFALARYFTEMERRLSDPVDPVEPLADVRIVPLTDDLVDSARLARNDAFRDHWGSQPTTSERWEHMTSSPEFRKDLSRVAVETTDAGEQRVVAFALISVNKRDWEAAGYSKAYIEYIGVVRDHRGERLAPAIITAALQSLRDVGIERATLDVDSESPTGANTLYERMGFTAGERGFSYVLEV